MMAAAGAGNTGVGVAALRDNTGCSNTAVGNYALRQNTAASGNTAVGDNALRCNTTGNRNTAIGSSALFDNVGGYCNIAIGNGTLLYSTGDNRNIAIGAYSQTGISGANNTIAIGSGASTSSTTGHTVWGNSSNNQCNCVYAAWSNVSDCRDKANVKTLPSTLGLEFINKLRPVSFNWDHRDTYVRECKYEYGTKDGNLVSTKEHYGLIAQELKTVLDDLGVKFDGLGHDDEKDAYRLTYEELIAPIIKAIQEQQVQIESLKTKIEILEQS